MSKKKVIIFLSLFSVFILFGCAKDETNEENINLSLYKCDINEKKIIFQIPSNEILSAEIGIQGGILRGRDNIGQWVVVNIPAGSLKSKVIINLSIEKSTYSVTSGIKSPLTFKITPDVTFNIPITITVLYESKYSCDKIISIVPYLVKEDGNLSLVNLAGLYKNQNIFTASTFHGGSYSWVYIDKF